MLPGRTEVSALLGGSALCPYFGMLKPIVLAFAVLLATPLMAFDQTDLDRLRTTGDCPRCDLSYANLMNANLFGADLVQANLRGADLSYAKLRDANLAGADLSGANLAGAYLWEADFTGADLTGANLTDVDLTRAVMRGAVLCNTAMPDGRVQNVGC